MDTAQQDIIFQLSFVSKTLIKRRHFMDNIIFIPKAFKPVMNTNGMCDPQWKQE